MQFSILCCDNGVLVFRLGFGTTTTWLRLGEHYFFGLKYLFWSLENHGRWCTEGVVSTWRWHKQMWTHQLFAEMLISNILIWQLLRGLTLLLSVILHPKKGNSVFICSLITTPASYITLLLFSCDLKWLKSRWTSSPLTNTPHFLWRRPVSLTDETTLFGNILPLSKVLRHRQWNEPFCNPIK